MSALVSIISVAVIITARAIAARRRRSASGALRYVSVVIRRGA